MRAVHWTVRTMRRSAGLSGPRLIGLLAALAVLPGVARAIPPCQDESITCILNGKIGEKFCTRGQWSACKVPNGAPLANPPPDPRCGDRNAQGIIKCFVEQPEVRRHERDYPGIVFAPGDTVYVEADGCAQSGGSGATWHRYVDPSGPDADHLYHGLIRIPTGTPNSALVRIKDEIEKPILVTGAGVDPATLYLHLGFEDDDYSDNGYWGHDDGPDGQCAYANGGYPASVAITIYRGVRPTPPTSRFDFDVVSNNPLDPNGLMYNPLWSWQLRPENAGKTPDTSTCHNFSERGSTLGIPDPYLSPSFADCTDQADVGSIDGRNLCRWSGQFSGGFGGHVNWFPVTVEGEASWGDHSGVVQQVFGDDDYTFSFTSEVAGNPLSVNGRAGLHVEFDSDETIDHFVTREWSQFHSAVDADDTATAEQLFDGHTILTGMFGLDADHMKAELHPLFAMATRRDAHDFEDSPGDEAWLMFARNSGDEGFCSMLLWSAGFEDYTFRLPWRAGMTSVTVNQAASEFQGTDGTSGPVVRAVPPAFPRNPGAEGVYVTFHLGPVSSRPLIEGVLHLAWSGPVVERRAEQAAGASAALQASARRALGSAIVRGGPQRLGDGEADDIEGRMAGAVHALRLDDRRAIQAARIGAASVRPRLHRLAFGGFSTQAAGRARERLVRPPNPAFRHATSVGPATEKLARDLAMTRVLCALTHGAPSGLPRTLCSPGAVSAPMPARTARPIVNAPARNHEPSR